MNTELVKHFMGLKKENGAYAMPEVSYFDIIKELNSYFGAENWTYEVESEHFFEDAKGKNVMTTVTVYVPGRISTGRSVCTIKDYFQNHLHAILDACNWFIVKNEVVPAPIEPANTTGQLTPEQIMAMTQGQQSQPQQPMVNTAAQFYNYKDEEGKPAGAVPMDLMTDNCQKELQEEMKPQPQSPVQQNTQSQNSSDYDTPQERLKGFSQHQIDRLNQFKKDFDVTDDKMFGNYVNTWDNRLASKADITPANVEGFLAWIDTLGKMDC